jgi:hypothetical protein
MENPKKISMEIPWNSMEFLGIFHGIPWKNFMKNPSNVYVKFHGIS